LLAFQLDNLYPSVKIMSDEVLQQAWIDYRDMMNRESKNPIDVMWLYAICLIILSIYSAVIVYFPEPDHKVFVQAEEVPEAKPCSSESIDATHEQSTDENPQQLLGRKNYEPLNKFLTVTKESV
jgi:hypothetical protein